MIHIMYSSSDERRHLIDGVQALLRMRQTQGLIPVAASRSQEMHSRPVDHTSARSPSRAPYTGSMRWRAARLQRVWSCGRSYWSDSWLQWPAARSEASPRDSWETHKHRSVRRSLSPDTLEAWKQSRGTETWTRTLHLNPSRVFTPVESVCTASWWPTLGSKYQSPTSLRSPWSERCMLGYHWVTVVWSGDLGCDAVLKHKTCA